MKLSSLWTSMSRRVIVSRLVWMDHFSRSRVKLLVGFQRLVDFVCRAGVPQRTISERYIIKYVFDRSTFRISFSLFTHTLYSFSDTWLIILRIIIFIQVFASSCVYNCVLCRIMFFRISVGWVILFERVEFLVYRPLSVEDAEEKCRVKALARVQRIFTSPWDPGYTFIFQFLIVSTASSDRNTTIIY